VCDRRHKLKRRPKAVLSPRSGAADALLEVREEVCRGRRGREAEAARSAEEFESVESDGTMRARPICDRNALSVTCVPSVVYRGWTLGEPSRMTDTTL
jgi:hypothetical protein